MRPMRPLRNDNHRLPARMDRGDRSSTGMPQCAVGTEVREPRGSQGADPAAEHPGSVPEEERRRLEPFGKELRALRKESGLSQQKLGELAGLRGDHVGRLERAQRRPSVGAIKALVRVLAAEPAREELEQRLAGLAGDSLREGAERKKQRRENRHRRLAVGSIQSIQRKLQTAIRQQEANGQIVSGTLRRQVELNTKVLERLNATAKPDPEPIKDHSPIDDPLRRARMTKAELLAWARSGL